MSAPAIILVRPQLGENIGKVARAMLNFGLSDLRLVNPRDGWPNPDAIPAAADADEVLENAKVFETTEEAIADLTQVFAATARHRDMSKQVLGVKEASALIRKSQSTGVLFGPEASGLSNDDIVLTNVILNIPTNPDFSSLNLAVAVGIVAHECFEGGTVFRAKTKSASKVEINSLIHHLESELDERGYFYPEERRKSLMHTLHNLFQSASFNSQQVQTFRGIIKALTKNGKK